MKKLTAAAALVALAMGGCAADNSTPDNASNKHSENVGSVSAALTLPLGFAINAVNYQVEDKSSAVVKSGPIDVTNSTRMEFQVGNLPIATGYQMLLTATTVPLQGQQPVNCAGSAGFDIANNGLTNLTMTLTCQGDIAIDTDSQGDVRVTVGVSQSGDYACPVVTGISALPAETQVGGVLALDGFLSSAADSSLWSGVGGTFSDASGLSTSFTCTAVGEFDLTLTANKNRCLPTSLTVHVTCSGQVPTSEAGLCTNGVDDDQDGLTDCKDSDCATDPACVVKVPETNCTDGIDNDNNGLTDCADPSCAADPACDACLTCAKTQCNNYQGLDLADPCFSATNGMDLIGGGTISNAPAFSQACTDAFECSVNAASGCSKDSIGPSRCYCGSSVTIDQCAATGPGADAECKTQWEVATGCDTITDPAARNSCVGNAFQDLTLPSGYAFFTIACVNDVCATQCK